MQIRTTKPEKGHKFYNTIANGGLSRCIVGSPTDKDCNVLANCVGYACGRFNEIIGEMKYPTLYTNAENFIEQAIKLGLSVVKEPSLGGIMVWQKGATLGGSDGAGHVEIVERIDSKNQIYTSSSAYKGSAFYNVLRTNANGKWGMGSGYTYRGCIVNPAIGYKPFVEPKPVMKFKVGDDVVLNGVVYGSADGKKKGATITKKVTKVTRVSEGSKYPYNTTGDLGWVAESSLTAYKKPATWLPKVGDIVVPTKLVDAGGRKIIQYDKTYQILSIVGNVATLGAVRGGQRPIWAKVEIKNLRKV